MIIIISIIVLFFVVGNINGLHENANTQDIFGVYKSGTYYLSMTKDKECSWSNIIKDKYVFEYKGVWTYTNGEIVFEISTPEIDDFTYFLQ